MYQEVRLNSKRNEVYRIFKDDKTYISKTFANIDDFYKEEEILNILKKNGANVPNIIESKSNKIIMEDLGQLTLLSWYEDLEKQNSLEYDEILVKLCCWIKNFHNITLAHFNEQVVLWDVNFRNFIIKNNEIYGVDFEQSCPGNREFDAGKLTAYALTYEPYMTNWKIKFRNK
ncbi:MAG: RIO1 family regulatory kinase/ATPase, partial [Sedimentibacter sp.]